MVQASALRGENPAEWLIGVVDGPNIPNIGARDPEKYGHVGSLDELQAIVRDFAGSIGVRVRQIASNHEGDILDFIHAHAASVDGWLVNPAGLTLYGEPTRTALTDSGKPFIEVHFANAERQFPRESRRNTVGSCFTEHALGMVMGLRHHSYLAALMGLTLALDDERFLAGAAQRAHTRGP